MSIADFPIQEVLPAICRALDSGTRLVLEAPPGAGKTTQVPLALINRDWCRGKKLLMLEPRRVAARAAANFMASQLGENVGETVGYRIRFENRVSARTRIEVVTEGILTRMIQDDPLLEGVGAILFDEFHERHLAGDLGLALALDVQSGLREDLRLLVMSATLDGETLASFLDAERISSAGRAFPVELEYFPATRGETLPLHLKRCLDRVLPASEGDVLVFLPGQKEIAEAQELLGRSWPELVQVPLYGELPVEQQGAALASDPEGRRRVVLATNIAESSVTLPGVRVVIDSGLAREPRFDPNSGFSRLQTVYISQASAEQRRGRAGRVAAGHCYRLWPKEQRLDAMRKPELLNVDLTGLALELAAWGSSDLRFVDTPPAGTFASARELLQKLGGLDSRSTLTPFGRRMLGLGTHPRLAAMLLSARDADEQSIACDLAALIESRDPLTGYRGDDWFSRWQALAAFRLKRKQSGVSRAALSALARTAAQWRRRIRCNVEVNEAPAHLLGDLLLHAFPDRIAHVHAADPLRYQLSNGRMARLHEESLLIGEPWLVAGELRFENRDSLVLRAAPLDEARLRQDFPERFSESDEARWDSAARALVSRRETRFDRIVLESKPGGRIDPALAAQALCDAVAELGLDSLPWSDRLRQWRLRVQCLRQWMPESGLPDLGDEALLQRRQEWLLPLFSGKSRLDALDASGFSAALQGLLDWNKQQLVEREAPERIPVPSGLQRPISYGANTAPVLAVKLQELFGLAETPRIAGGRIPLSLHLLSPGGKPLQITQDLHSFWENTYPEVKKEMKGRYPKHPWPEDPWSATATHRAKPRGT